MGVRTSEFYTRFVGYARTVLRYDTFARYLHIVVVIIIIVIITKCNTTIVVTVYVFFLIIYFAVNNTTVIIIFFVNKLTQKTSYINWHPLLYDQAIFIE